MSQDDKLPDILIEAENLAVSGKLTEALQKYEIAAANDPYNPLIAIGKSAVYKAMGEYEKCAVALGNALSVLPSWNVSKEDTTRFNQFTSMLHILRAEAYLYNQDITRVYDELDAADTISEANAASLVIRANAHALNKEWEKAGNLLYRAEEWCYLHEDSLLTQIWLTKIHCAKENGNIFTPSYAAEVYANRHWRIPTGTDDELIKQAKNLCKTGLLYDALRYYDALLAQTTHDKKAHVMFLKGKVFEQLKHFDEASDCYNKGLIFEPTYEEKCVIQKSLSNIKSGRSLN